MDPGALTMDGDHGDRFLTFAVENETFGLEIQYVTETIDMLQVAPITPIPEAPDYVKGIVNLRDKTIPLIDMRLRFGKTGNAYNGRTKIIVVDIQFAAVGLIVDSVSGIVTIGKGFIIPLLKDIQGLRGIGKAGKDVKLLDIEQLFVVDELDSITVIH